MEAERANRWAVSRWLPHAPVAIAVGAVVLYAFGIVSTVGKLRASHLDVTQTFGRIPLEAHLRNGVALVASPAFFGVLILGGAAYLVLRWEPKKRRSKPIRGGIYVLWAYRVLATLVMIALFLNASWPDALFLFVVGLATVIGVWMFEFGKQPTNVQAMVATVVGLGFMLVLLTWAAYFRSDPLPTARLSIEGGHLTGPLIATDGGVLYLGATDAKKLYVAVPTSEVDSFTTTQEHRRDEPTALDYLSDWL